MAGGKELDVLVAEKVMGWQKEHRYEGGIIRWRGTPPAADRFGYVYTGEGAARQWSPSTDIAAAWQVVEVMTARMGYDNIGFLWQGPLFKPEHRYMTAEGYPLGTTCWYVILETDGYRGAVCADTAPLAICRAALQALALKD